MSESFHRDMSAGYAMWASSYAAKSTSKAKQGLLMLAQAHADEAMRLAPPTPEPDVLPEPTLPPAGRERPVASLAVAYAVPGAVGARTDAEVIPRRVGRDSRREYDNVRFDIGDWFGVESDSDELFTFVDCTFDGRRADRARVATFGAVLPRGLFIRCEFVGLDNFARVGGGSAMWNCWGRDPVASKGSHVDGVEISTGSGIEFVNCYFEIPTNADTGGPEATGATAALNVAPDFGDIDDLLVESCVLIGGGMPLLIRQQGGGSLSNIRVRNTVLGGGRWGPVNTDGVAKQAIVEWENVTTPDGTPIPKP